MPLLVVHLVMCVSTAHEHRCASTSQHADQPDVPAGVSHSTTQSCDTNKPQPPTGKPQNPGPCSMHAMSVRDTCWPAPAHVAGPAHAFHIHIHTTCTHTYIQHAVITLWRGPPLKQLAPPERGCVGLGASYHRVKLGCLVCMHAHTRHYAVAVAASKLCCPAASARHNSTHVRMHACIPIAPRCMGAHNIIIITTWGCCGFAISSSSSFLPSPPMPPKVAPALGALKTEEDLPPPTTTAAAAVPVRQFACCHANSCYCCRHTQPGANTASAAACCC